MLFTLYTSAPVKHASNMRDLWHTILWMIYYYYSDKKSPAIAQQDTIHVDGWIRAERPTDDEKDLLIGLGIDAGILTDALDPHEVPRIEHDDGWTYLITRVPDVGDDFNDLPLIEPLSGLRKGRVGCLRPVDDITKKGQK